MFDVWLLIKEKGFKLDTKLLRKKLQRSYDAAPPGKKKEAREYVMDDIISRVKQSTTEKAWNNELGGLLMRPKPDRLVVVGEVCQILSQVGDVILE